MNFEEMLEWTTKNLEYRDGELWWKAKGIGRRRYIPIGTLDKRHGYLRMSIHKGDKHKSYLVHRIIFLMHNGYLPEVVDHIDGNPLNNKIENLRAASLSQNQQNAKLAKTNTSGLKGVHFDKRDKVWIVQIWANGKRINHRHKDCITAEQDARELREKYHGAFARHA